MTGFGRARVTPEPEGIEDVGPVRPAETPEQRLRRAREALAEAEAEALAGAGRDPAGSDGTAGARRSPRGSARRSSGRPTRGSSRRSARAGPRGASDADPAAEVDLSSWPGAGHAPDWVPDVAADPGVGGDVPSGTDDELADLPLDPEEEAARARQIVLRQLAMAPRSRAQLTDKLAARDVDPDIAEEVLDRFEEVGLVDDVAFAETLVRAQQESRGLSRRGLRHELRKKGVDPDVAEDALAAVDVESERARAEELVASRLRRLHGLPREVQLRRLAGFLARKGYPGDLAFSVIRQALDNAEEHARD